MERGGAGMPRREFFARAPMWVRLLPSAAIGTLLVVPYFALRALGVTENVEPFQIAMVVLKVSVFIGIAFLALLALAVVGAALRPIPILTFDDERLATPLTKLPWAQVRRVDVRPLLWMRRLCVSTYDDGALVRRSGYPRNLRYWVTRWLTGAPVALPELDGITLEEASCLAEEYRKAAGAASENAIG